MPQINFWAVLVSAVVYFVIGWVWHSPLMFGKVWEKWLGFDKLSKKEKKAMMKKMGPVMGVAFLTTLLAAYCLAYTVMSGMSFYHVAGVSAGLQAGFWTWLGFIVTTQLNGVLWEKKPFKIYLINISYYLVSFLVMGSILAVWQ